MRPVRLPADLAGLDALALPGGESTTISRLLSTSGLDEPLRHELAAGLPVFATCAGLILLSRDIEDGRPGQAGLGIFDVAVQRNGYGRQVASFEADISIAALESPFRAVFIRAPRISTVGPEAEVLASHAGDPVLIRHGRSLGMVFHPEITSDDRLQKLFLDGVGRGRQRDAA